MARQRWPGVELDSNQLTALAAAVRTNAGELLDDSRLLLAAGRHARAHALAVVAFEELGKLMLCFEALIGVRNTDSLLADWASHRAKLEHGHVWALLNVASYPATNVVDRLEAAVTDDSTTKLRGLYVDPGPAGVVFVPDLVTADQAAELVQLVSAAVAITWEIELDSIEQRAASALGNQLRVSARAQLTEIQTASTWVDGLPEPERSERIRAAKEVIDIGVANFRQAVKEPPASS